MQELAHKTLINRKTLLSMIPLSDRTIYNLEQRGEFLDWPPESPDNQYHLNK